jgi:hypothetical protein
MLNKLSFTTDKPVFVEFGFETYGSLLGFVFLIVCGGKLYGEETKEAPFSTLPIKII